MQCFFIFLLIHSFTRLSQCTYIIFLQYTHRNSVSGLCPRALSEKGTMPQRQAVNFGIFVVIVIIEFLLVHWSKLFEYLTSQYIVSCYYYFWFDKKEYLIWKLSPYEYTHCFQNVIYSRDTQMHHKKSKLTNKTLNWLLHFNWEAKFNVNTTIYCTLF